MMVVLLLGLASVLVVTALAVVAYDVLTFLRKEEQVCDGQHPDGWVESCWDDGWEEVSDFEEGPGVQSKKASEGPAGQEDPC